MIMDTKSFTGAQHLAYGPDESQESEEQRGSFSSGFSDGFENGESQ